MGVMPTSPATRRIVTASAPSLSSRRREAVAILRVVGRAIMYTVYTCERAKSKLISGRAAALHSHQFWDFSCRSFSRDAKGTLFLFLFISVNLLDGSESAGSASCENG